MFIEHLLAFAKGEKVRVLWKCSILATLWVIWLERNNKIFVVSEEEYVNFMWDGARFVASLWSSVSKELQDIFCSIHLNWEGVLG